MDDTKLYLIGTKINEELGLDLLDEFLIQKYVAIYWEGVGDLRKYHDKNEIREKLSQVPKYKDKTSQALDNYAQSLYDFAHKIRPEIDRVAVYDPNNKILYIGIPGDYEYLPRLEDLYRSHQRSVKTWIYNAPINELPEPLKDFCRHRPKAVWEYTKGRYADLGIG